MAKTGRPLLDNRDAALWLGVLAWGVGSLLLWDAYENRGRRRPFAWKLAALIP